MSADRGDRSRTSTRRVRSQDPSLSPEANRILSDELRETTGNETVGVPADRPRTSDQAHGGRSRVRVALEANRIALGMTFLAALVVITVISLATGSWWFLALALVVLAITVALVVVLVLQLTTETEHVSPTEAARLEDEGVGDPDAVLSELVEEYAPGEDAAAEQKSVTPTPRRSRPVGPS